MVGLLIKKAVYPKSIYFAGIERFSPGTVVDTDRKSTLRFGNRVSLHSRCRVSSSAGGQLSIGDHTAFNAGCIVVCRHKITIGDRVSFGPNVLVYDHDHVMNREIGAKGSEFTFGAVEIGDNCWIGAGSIILSGATIGKNCVIAAGSIVKGTVPDGTTLIQKRTNTYKGME